MTGPEREVLFLALALTGVLAFLPPDQAHTRALLTPLVLVATALALFHQCAR